MTFRDSGPGAVRRLLVAAFLALIAVGTGWAATPPTVSAAEDQLPNLRAERPTDFRIQEVNGRRLLRFTATMHNIGKGPIEILGRRDSTHQQFTVQQVIRQTDGSTRRQGTDATLVYAGDGHDHWHVRKMMSYHVWGKAGTRGDAKVGFCFFDTNLRYPDLPGSPSARYYRESWCGTRTSMTSRTGISVGWADRYPWNLAFQWIDITGWPGGTYTVRAVVDPKEWFLESGEKDNCSYARISFGSTGSSVRVLGSGRGCVNDWQDHSLRASIDWAYAAGITGGCDTLVYCPNAPVTRAQMAMFLDRAMELPPTEEDFFSDDDGVTGEGSINRLAAAGITGGCSPTRYCPKANVTRAQMAAFLVRALDLPPATTADRFRDDDSSTHEADIDSLAEAGITGGCAAERFCPTAPVTRAQMAAFLFRAFANPPPEE